MDIFWEVVTHFATTGGNNNNNKNNNTSNVDLHVHVLLLSSLPLSLSLLSSLSPSFSCSYSSICLKLQLMILTHRYMYMYIESIEAAVFYILYLGSEIISHFTIVIICFNDYSDHEVEAVFNSSFVCTGWSLSQ